MIRASKALKAIQAVTFLSLPPPKAVIKPTLLASLPPKKGRESALRHKCPDDDADNIATRFENSLWG
jgi:hypothetical protein